MKRLLVCLILANALAVSQCTTEDPVPTLPVVNTASIKTVTFNKATSGGEVVSDGGARVIVRGVVWGLTPDLTTALSTKSADGLGEGIFSSEMPDLLPGTNYFVRAYAVNDVGTAYGNPVLFSTLTTFPELSTAIISGITSTSAASGGNITSNGGTPVTARGVCWNTSTIPTIDHFKTSDGTGDGYFASNITGLNPGTMYYVRAYAVNAHGISYGRQVIFSTP